MEVWLAFSYVYTATKWHCHATYNITCADHTIVYLIQSKKRSTAVNKLNLCISQDRAYMICNKLKINYKT